MTDVIRPLCTRPMWECSCSHCSQFVDAKKDLATKLFFCESMYSRPDAPWHIRWVTDRGAKLGGGADTPALCERVVTWDLAVPISEHHLKHNCPICRQVYYVILNSHIGKGEKR